MHTPTPHPASFSYETKIAASKLVIAKKLLRIMLEKKTNLVLAADVTSAHELLHLARSLGAEIAMLKTHIDIINDFSPRLLTELAACADEHNFLIFEDRKFADIGNTVAHQYGGGIYQIANWAHITNAHSLPGDSIIQGLKTVGAKKERGLLLIAEMSSANHLLTGSYKECTLNLARQHSDFVIGFITQTPLSAEPSWLNLTPGVQIAVSADHLGQRYRTPWQAIYEQGSDLIIVGRGILTAPDQKAIAQEYQAQSWQAYLARCQI